MGDLPLRTPTDRWLGGPLPRQQPNQTHPHPLAENLYSKSDAIVGKHRGLIRISTGYALLRGRLDTRYSPVRRSPASIASYRPDAPRLACVKPVASVHPEPGSNSSLYKKKSQCCTIPDKQGTAACLTCHRTTIQIIVSSSLHLDGSCLVLPKHIP